MWTGVIADFVIGPVFLNGPVTAASYSLFLREELPGLLEDLPLNVRQRMFFQQDGHPAHRSDLAVAVLNEMFPNRWIGIRGYDFPARCPDLTVMAFFIWGFVKSEVFKNGLPEDREALVAMIRQAFRLLTPQMLSNARNTFAKRIALCLEQGGGYFEHLL